MMSSLQSPPVPLFLQIKYAFIEIELAEMEHVDKEQ